MFEQGLRRPNRRRIGWLVAAGVSLAAHVGVAAALLALARPDDATDARAARLEPPPPLRATLVSFPADVGAPPAAEPIEVEVDVAAPARPWDAREGDRDNPIARTSAPRDADGRIRRTPAADDGARGGAPDNDAYRLDNSTARARVTDGAARAQPARLRSASAPASPQAIRREPTTGIGDSVATRRPSRALEPAPRAPALSAADGEAAGPASDRAPAPAPPVPPTAARVEPRPTLAHETGPLDAETGARSFDVERPGRADDDQTLRAASPERHPGLTDFSRPTARALIAAADGRGPARDPGAVDRASAGDAPQALGARDPRASASDVNERTLDRRYSRYVQEIRGRVDRELIFPKALALRLEQGQTIVQFLVGVDGRLREGPRVVKSSGFEEFDRAALRAVLRAAPFPPMPEPARPQPVFMPVTFDNPVIR